MNKKRKAHKNSILTRELLNDIDSLDTELKGKEFNPYKPRVYNKIDGDKLFSNDGYQENSYLFVSENEIDKEKRKDKALTIGVCSALLALLGILVFLLIRVV